MLTETEFARTIESRSRMISFRVTAEEFERFRRLCLMKGLRNVSEVIRLAVNQLLEDDDQLLLSAPAEQTIFDRFEQLESRLAYLESKVITPVARTATTRQ